MGLIPTGKAVFTETLAVLQASGAPLPAQELGEISDVTHAVTAMAGMGAGIPLPDMIDGIQKTTQAADQAPDATVNAALAVATAGMNPQKAQAAEAAVPASGQASVAPDKGGNSIP